MALPAASPAADNFATSVAAAAADNAADDGSLDDAALPDVSVVGFWVVVAVLSCSTDLASIPAFPAPSLMNAPASLW